MVLAVNKMDLVGWDKDVFHRIKSHFAAVAAELKFHSMQSIPLSALTGGSVTIHDDASPWYAGPTLNAWRTYRAKIRRRARGFVCVI